MRKEQKRLCNEYLYNMKERKFDLFEKKCKWFEINGGRKFDRNWRCLQGRTIMVIYRNMYRIERYMSFRSRSKDEIHKNACSFDRTSIRGRRLHEYEWTESEDGSGSTASGSRLSRATGSCGYIYPRISTTAGRSRTNYFYFVAHVSSLFPFLIVGTVLRKLFLRKILILWQSINRYNTGNRFWIICDLCYCTEY